MSMYYCNRCRNCGAVIASAGLCYGCMKLMEEKRKEKEELEESMRKARDEEYNRVANAFKKTCPECGMDLGKHLTWCSKL